MALFFDHPAANARRFILAHLPSRPSRRPGRTRIGPGMPHHICLRLAGARLVTLAALLALVLAIRWYA